MYPVLAERSFVPCSLIMWLWLMLCPATVLFDSDLDGLTAFLNINPAAFTWDAVYTQCS